MIEAIQGIEPTSQLNVLNIQAIQAMMGSQPTENDETKSQKTKHNRYNPIDLYEALKKLNIKDNKYHIIRQMPRAQIIALLYLVSKDNLVQSMALFPRQKLLRFINMLPKETLLKMLLWVMPLRVLLQHFTTDMIFMILRSKRLNMQDFVKGLENLPLEALQKLMKAICNQNVDHLKHGELLNMFFKMDKRQIIEGMKMMPFKHLLNFVEHVVKQDPQLLMSVPREAYLKIFETMPKPNLVELFRLLPENILIQFLAQLPDQLLAMAASQIDDTNFESALINQFPDLVMNLASQAA